MSRGGSAKEGIVGFRLPGETPVWWKGPVVEELNSGGFVIAPFDRTHAPVVLAPTYQSAEAPAHWPPLKACPDHTEDDRQTYRQKVQQALRSIDEGTTDKIVLSRAATDHLRVDPVAFFEALTATYPEAFVYLLWTPQHGCWAGATPETLLAYHDGSWHTQSLAGTLPLHAVRNWSDKEYLEQQLVTDTIVASLTQAGFVPKVGERRTVGAGAVQHLSTPIAVEAPYDQATAVNLARQLHPTPAVCGLPRDQATTAIAAIEQRNRQLYTGYLGPVMADSAAQLFVNLRCCQLWKDAVTLHVGGGIVAGSEPEAEWEETENKARTLRSVLQKVARP